MSLLWSRRFRARRIPGTLSLAVVNLIGATVLFEPDTMTDTRVHRVALQMMPVALWASLFLVAGVGLVAASVTLRTLILHTFGALSLALWVGMTTAAFMSDLTDDSFRLSGIALALFVWMLLGPLAMLLAPLIAERYDDRRK